jgi:hypothetical protein
MKLELKTKEPITLTVKEYAEKGYWFHVKHLLRRRVIDGTVISSVYIINLVFDLVGILVSMVHILIMMTYHLTLFFLTVFIHAIAEKGDAAKMLADSQNDPDKKVRM